MHFRGWQKTSLIEYPGKISTVLFTGKCNFRCPFCYNRDVVLESNRTYDIDEKEVLDYLKERKKLYQAVIVTGGEPTMHKGLPDFYRKIRALGFLTGLETNGTSPEMLKELLDNKLVDYVAMDIKAPLVWEKYSKATRTKDKRLFGNVLKSVRLLMASGVRYEFRTTVVPRLHSEEDILELAGQLGGAKTFALQQFTPKDTTLDPKFAKAKPYPDAVLKNLREKISGNFETCELRNVND